jgi:hypothetical protein
MGDATDDGQLRLVPTARTVFDRVLRPVRRYQRTAAGWAAARRLPPGERARLVLAEFGEVDAAGIGATGGGSGGVSAAAVTAAPQLVRMDAGVVAASSTFGPSLMVELQRRLELGGGVAASTTRADERVAAPPRPRPPRDDAHPDDGTGLSCGAAAVTARLLARSALDEQLRRGLMVVADEAPGDRGARQRPQLLSAVSMQQPPPPTPPAEGAAALPPPLPPPQQKQQQTPPAPAAYYVGQDEVGEDDPAARLAAELEALAAETRRWYREYAALERSAALYEKEASLVRSVEDAVSALRGTGRATEATRSSFLRNAELVVDGVRASADRARDALEARRATRDALAAQMESLLADAARKGHD